MYNNSGSAPPLKIRFRGPLKQKYCTMKKKLPNQTPDKRIETRSRFIRVTPPPARTSKNDPFIDRLRRLWEAAREHDQHVTAQTAQDMLLSYKALNNRHKRRAFRFAAEGPLRKLERPYFDDVIEALDNDDE